MARFISHNSEGLVQCSKYPTAKIKTFTSPLSSAASGAYHCYSLDHSHNYGHIKVITQNSQNNRNFQI